jgi:hypothetical protein
MPPIQRECPYLERDDARCEPRFHVGQLDAFFALCCGTYRRCPTYHRIRAESGADDEALPARPAARPLAVTLTAHGRPLGIRGLLS